MAEEKVLFGLDLDSKDFESKINNALNLIDKFADPKKFNTMVSGLLKVTAVIGGVAVAAAFLKSKFDDVLRAEEIHAVNKEFELLTENAGVSGETLKSAFLKATGGTIAETEAIKMANEAIIKMGDNAGKIPEIMTLAKKVSMTTGKDINEVFSNLTQAISFGNQRMLRQYGLTVDVDNVTKKFAASMGVTVDSLTEAGKRQAVLNAALENGQKKFKGISGDMMPAHAGLKQIKAAVEDIREVFALLAEKTFGPFVRNLIESVARAAKELKLFFKSSFGEGREAAESELERTKVAITSLEKSIKDGPIKIQSMYKEGLYRQESADEFNKRVESNRLEITRLTEQLKKQEDAFKSSYGSTEKEIEANKQKYIDQQKAAEQEAKFQQDRAAMIERRASDDLKYAQTQEQLEQATDQKLMAIDVEYYAKLEEIKNSAKLNDDQRKLAEETAELEHQSKLRQIAEEEEAHHEQMMANRVNHSKTAASGMANAFAEGADKNKRALTNWGNTGRIVFNSFEKNSVSALQAWGAGTKSASEAAAGFVYGMIADTAEAKGKEMLLASVWPPNPAGMAAGAGLIALSGLLRSKAGGGGLGGGGGEAGGGATSFASAAEKPELKEVQKKSVTIAVQNMWDSEQTRRRIVEMVREESDATDFEFRKIT